METARVEQNKIYRESFSSPILGKEKGPGVWLSDLRRKAYGRFEVLGFPDRRNESWKYINLEPLLGSAFLAGAESVSSSVSQKESEPFFLPGTENRLVFLNGIYSKPLSLTSSRGAGLLLSDFSTALQSHSDLLKHLLASRIEKEANPFAAINTFSFRDGAFVHVPDHLTPEAPIHLLFVNAGSGDGTLSYPRILIVAGKCARVKVVVDFVSLGDQKVFSNAVAEVHLGEGACLDFFQIQRSGEKATQFSTNRYFLKGYATLNAYAFTQGGAVTRNEDSVEFGGEGGFASLKGLSMLKGDSQIFNHPAAHHDVPHCTSRQFYKSILSGKAKSEFNSLVSVPKKSQKSDSHQMNRNLLLSDTAQAYSRPQLRIDTDDVQCVHGATTGQLQKDELFYLRSRGLSEQRARFLMTYGFAEEILEGMPGDLRPVLENLAQEELRAMIGSVEKC